MKKILSSVKEWFCRVQDRVKERRAAHRAKELDRRVSHELRVMDYADDLYLSFEGIPLVKVGAFREDWSAVLSQVRAFRKDYLEASDHGKRSE